MINRVTELEIVPGQELWHICRMYKDTIKTVYCLKCHQKDRNDKRKLARFQLTHKK